MAKHAVKAMKRGSFRDSIAKTVRLLTRDTIKVEFRGFQPMVVTQGDKVIRMVLPEIGDDATPDLIDAMHGFLDHECGHIFYTPFARAAEFHKGNRLVRILLNIVEDIRLEKLLPRDLPGTKDNLERMYESAIPKMFHPNVVKAIANGSDPQQMMQVTIVPGFRALAGQKAFMRYMDDNALWPWLTPLSGRMPTIAADLQAMETYDDVEKIVQNILDAMDPKDKEDLQDAADDQPDMAGACPESEDEPSDTDGDEPGDADPSDDTDGDESGEGEDADKTDGDKDDEGNSSEGDEADDGGDDGDGDDESEDEGGGEGHGDGEGTDDGSDEEGGDCSGDEDDAGDEDGKSNSTGDKDKDTEDSADDDESDGSGKSDGKSNRNITNALKSLEATQRKVLYLHKNKRRSIERIASDMRMTPSEVETTLRDARRNLSDFMLGDK